MIILKHFLDDFIESDWNLKSFGAFEIVLNNLWPFLEQFWTALRIILIIMFWNLECFVHLCNIFFWIILDTFRDLQWLESYHFCLLFNKNSGRNYSFPDHCVVQPKTLFPSFEQLLITDDPTPIQKATPKWSKFL